MNNNPPKPDKVIKNQKNEGIILSILNHNKRMKKSRVLILFLTIGIASIQFCFSQKCETMKGKFLIVMDIQEYYTSGKLSFNSTQSMIESANGVIENTDAGHVIYLSRVHKLLNLSFGFPLVYISLDTNAMRLDSRLILVNENRLTREHSNAFASAELKDYLKQNNAKEIVVIGLLAEEFVYQSLLAGKELGYDMYLIPEAILGKTQKKKDKAIKKLAKRGVNVIRFSDTIDINKQ